MFQTTNQNNTVEEILHQLVTIGNYWDAYETL